MITNTTARMTYTFTEGITEYAVGFVYQTNPDNSPQIKVYVNDEVNTPLTYGTDYTMSLDGTKVVIASGAEVGDTLTIIRDIPIVQLSDYVIGRIDPEQIERDFDLCVERDQQQSARVTVTEEQLAAHDERISAVEEIIPESASTENMLATAADIPTVGNGTITITQGGATKGTFTTNQSGNTTINVDAMSDVSWSDISDKPTFATVATSGNYNDLSNKPTIPSAQVNSDWDAESGVAQILNKPTIPTVGNGTITITQGGVSKGTFTTNQSGDTTIALDAGGGGAVDSVNGYTGVVVLAASDVGALPDSTTIPDAQIQSDWDQSDNTKVDYIKNKPTLGTMAAENASDYTLTASLATVATTGDYDDLLDKPTIPAVNDATITFTQGGETKGTITLNQASAATISLDAGGSSGHEVIAFQEPTAQNNYTWYRKYADGWVEQGGHKASVSYGGTAITFPVTMADTNYQIQNTPVYDSTYCGMGTSGDKSTTGAKLRVYTCLLSTGALNSNGTLDCDWQVSGMAQG